MQHKLLLNILHIVIDGLFGSVPIILSFMVISFGAAEKEAGIVISLANLANTMIGLSAIFLSRHLGIFRTLSLTILLYAASYLANSFSADIILAGICFIIGNCGFAVFHTVSFAYLSSHTEKGVLGRTLGDFTAVGDVGRILLSSSAGFLAAFTIFGFPGWRTVCLGYGILAALFAVYLFFVPPGEKRRKSPIENAPSGEKRHLPDFSLLRHRQYTLSLSASMLDAFGSTQVFTFLPFLLFAKGIDPKVIGAFALAFTVGGFVGKTALGRMVDRYGANRLFYIAEAVMALLLVMLVLADQFYVVVIASLLLGIVSRGTVPVVQMIVTEPVRESREYNDIFAINNFSRGIANITSPLLYGFIASAAGISWSFCVMAAVVIFAVIPILLMNSRKRTAA